MNLVTLTETIIKKIVSDPESVSVKEFETEEENTMQIEVLISSDDMGKVIGKNGKIINSIRTIVQASSSLEDNKKVTAVDERYFKLAENQLYGELAFALGVQKSEINQIIEQNI